VKLDKKLVSLARNLRENSTDGEENKLKILTQPLKVLGSFYV
jgi:hypothetical protein